MERPQSFVIRRAFVFPLGVLIALTVALLVTCFVQGQSTAKILILSGLVLPLTILFVESVYRRVIIDSEGVTAYRPFRNRRIRFAEISSLETVRVRNRVFLTLVTAADDFLILSNSYGEFPALLNSLAKALPDEAITEETKSLILKPPVRLADIFTAWFAVIALAYVLFAQFKS